MTRLSFPSDFKWGSAVWALGVEGGSFDDGRTPTVLDEDFRLHPGRFFDGVGPADTLDWRHDVERYAAIAQGLGHTSFRTSIQWARLMPDGRTVSQSAADFYRREFSAFHDRGIELSVVLYWFDMPLWQEKRGGFTKRVIEDDFVRYCRTCFELFEGLVDVWYVYNEPTVDMYMKYAWEKCYPNRVSWQDICHATYNMVVAHARVVEAFRAGGFSGKIGSVFAHSHVYSKDGSAPERIAARENEVLLQTCFDDPLLGGHLCAEWVDIVERSGVVLDRRSDDEELIARNTMDLIGLNVYAPERVCHRPGGYTVSGWLGAVIGGNLDHQDPDDAAREEAELIHAGPYEFPGARMNADRGWEIFPRVIYDSLMDIERAYPGTETRITENGIGVHDEARFRGDDGMIDDAYRIEYLAEHIAWAHRAIADGARLTAYNVWSFVDLWSPSNQFKNCYGLIEYDRATGEVRRKRSAEWFERLSRENALEVTERHESDF